MADSDNSTSPSAVTRRQLLTGTVLLASPHMEEEAADEGMGDAAPEEVLALWQEWRNAHRRTAQLCRKQQRLETALANTVGFPSLRIAIPGRGEVTVFSQPQLDGLFEGSSARVAMRKQARDALAARIVAWRSADAVVGYSAAKRAEEESARHEQKLARTIWNTPASTPAGAAAKLETILRHGESSERCSEFPWPQIRSVMRDLLRM